jgi:hypothetical protein
MALTSGVVAGLGNDRPTARNSSVGASDTGTALQVMLPRDSVKADDAGQRRTG